MKVKMIGWKCSKADCDGQIVKEISQKYVFGRCERTASPTKKRVWKIMVRFTCAKCDSVHIPDKDGNAGVKI